MVDGVPAYVIVLDSDQKKRENVLHCVMSLVTYCAEKEVADCLESLRCLQLLLQGLANPVFTLGI